MAGYSSIEWTDATWNPVTGCTVVSPGCANCYAMRMAGTRLQHHPSRAGLTKASKAGPVWNGQVRLNEQWIDQPLRWTRPRMIFVCAHGDLFHEGVPDKWIDGVFAVMALAQHHTFQVLTKRADRMLRYMTGAGLATRIEALTSLRTSREGLLCGVERWPLVNVWLGVSVEDQRRADERIPHLLATPATVRWISAEPLLGPVDLTRIDVDGWGEVTPLSGWSPEPGALDSAGRPAGEGHPRIDWVVAGGESGPGARPMHADWARSLRDQCAAAGVAFHFKQWGQWSPLDLRAGGDLGGDVSADRVRIVHPTGQSNLEVSLVTGGRNTVVGSRYMESVGKARAGRLLDGIEHNGLPTMENRK